MIIKGFKVKVNLAPQEKIQVRQMVGIKRLVWNTALAYKKDLWETYKRRNPCIDNPEEKKLINMLSSNTEIQKAFAKKELVKYEGFEFISLLPNRCLQQALNDLNLAYNTFFDKKLKNGYPNFKKKSDSIQSIRFLDGLEINKLNNKNLEVKMGSIRLKGLNPERGNKHIFSPETKINNITLSIDNLDNVYTSVSYSYVLQENKHLTYSKDPLGIDMGITNTVSLSGNKGFRDLPNKLKDLEIKKRRLQRRNMKNKKRTVGSRSWNKTKKQIAKIYRKQTNIREDFYHKLSDELTKNHGMIFHEDLNISNMSKSAKGTLEKPGKNVAQKRGLNREILNQSWGRFFTFLKYKGEHRGVLVMPIDPKLSSQTCFKCEHIDPQSRNGKIFKCVKCSYTADADTNSSNIILTRGLRELAEREDLKSQDNIPQRPQNLKQPL